MSSELYAAMDRLLSCGVVNRHSYFQLKYFVVGKEPTIHSKMWKCIRELQSRRESLDAMKLEIEDTTDNLSLIDVEIARLENKQPIVSEDIKITELNKIEYDILLRKQNRRKKALQTSLESLIKKQKETEEEAFYFLKAFEAMASVEPLKPFDDLTEQTKYWNEKLTQLINLKILLHLPLDTELVQTAMSLSDDCPIKNELTKLLTHERLKLEAKPNGS